MRVQEHIVRSGRLALTQKKWYTLRSAYIEMRARAKRAQWSYRTYDYSGLGTETRFKENAHLESDYNTYIDVVSNGGARRRFTLVEKRGSEPIEWGTLLDKKATS